MATIVVQQQPALNHATNTTPPLTPSLKLSTQSSPAPVPNKHIPYCSPGPLPSQNQIVTPPNSPPSRNASPKHTSLLYPPIAHERLLNSPPIYGIKADKLAAALQELATQPMTNPASVFPWLHGLHPDNHTQLAFFVARKTSLRKVPKNLRGITIIKAGGDLSRSRIRGAVAPDEVMTLCDDHGRGFVDCDPPQGFSVRNFHIQTTKMSQVSDIIVYGDDRTDHRIIKSVAERAAAIQKHRKKLLEHNGESPETYNTFVLTSTFAEFEQSHPELVAVDSRGRPSGRVLDFLQRERAEMSEMTKASEISPGVFLGPSSNPRMRMTRSSSEAQYDVLIECSDHAAMPDEKTLSVKLKQLNKRQEDDIIQIMFPSSGSIMPPSWSHTEVDGILRMCHWIHEVTRSTKAASHEPDQDGDIQMSELCPNPRRVLIHCPDGYTETSLLTIAYSMFAEGLPLHETWIKLHAEKKRNFFAYPSDVALLKAMQDRILSESPANKKLNEKDLKAPAWLAKLDGSLPSRILPYMYLGNLTHANNPEMLKQLGIKRILSIGEPVSWSKGEWDSWGRPNLMFVDRIQDNGIDELGSEIERCLDFIGKLSSRSHSSLLTNLSKRKRGRYSNFGSLPSWCK